jgi:hypothetical protein
LTRPVPQRSSVHAQISQSHPGPRGLLTAAAVFWFEAWGLMGLAYASIISPLSCWAGGCAPSGVPTLFRGGTFSSWAIDLAAVGAGSLALWIATDGYRHARAVGFLAVGALAIGAIGWGLLVSLPTGAAVA